MYMHIARHSLLDASALNLRHMSGCEAALGQHVYCTHIYIYIHVYIYIHTYTCMHVEGHTHLVDQTRFLTQSAHNGLRSLGSDAILHVYGHVYECVYMSMYVYIYIYIYIYIYAL
jgi:hypothetical protein